MGQQRFSPPVAWASRTRPPRPGTRARRRAPPGERATRGESHSLRIINGDDEVVVTTEVIGGRRRSDPPRQLFPGGRLTRPRRVARAGGRLADGLDDERVAAAGGVHAELYVIPDVVGDGGPRVREALAVPEP